MENVPPTANGPPSTSTIPDLFLSATGDPIVGLRVYGTDSVRSFPTEPWEVLRVANESGAEVYINDPSVSRRGASGFGHATIRRQGASVVVADAGSKNGTFIEGERRGMFELRAGGVVTFGGVAMVAMSARIETVRARFMRFLGFHPSFLLDVEHAVFASIRRLHVVAHVPPGGFEGLVRIFHETAPGTAWPLYIVNDRIPNDVSAQRAILRRARLGTLVVPAEFWPADATTLREALIAPRRDLRMIFVAPRGEPGRLSTPAEHYLGRELRDLTVSIDEPPLALRGAMEIDRSIHGAVQEYGVPLGLPGPVFSPGELVRLTSMSWSGNAEELDVTIRRVTRGRLVGLDRAAELEGIDVESLRRWMKRHKFPLKTPTT